MYVILFLVSDFMTKIVWELLQKITTFLVDEGFIVNLRTDV